MKSELYVVKDNVAQESGPIFHAKNLPVAQRMFLDLIKDATTPDDYSLYYLGTFDHDTMTIVLDGSTTTPTQFISRSNDKSNDN